MNRKFTATSVVVGALWSATAFAQSPTGDNSLQHWMAMGPQSRVQLEDGERERRVLRFDYHLERDQYNALATPLTPGALKGLGSLVLRAKADYSTSFVAMVEEEGGGRFSAPFSVVADKWQIVQLAPSDFVLQRGGDNPTDADGKLDWSRVKILSVVDFNQTFVQGAAMENSPFAGLAVGAHTLRFDEFTLSQTPLPAAKTETEVGVIDDFAREQASWLGVGNVALERVNDGALDGPALKMSYPQQAGRIAGMIKLLAPDSLKGRRSLNFDVVALESAVLIVELEEIGGGKYNATVEVPGRANFTQVSLNFEDFKTADDSRDNNGRLDLGDVKQVVILDLTGMMRQREGDNKLWLGAVRARG